MQQGIILISWRNRSEKFKPKLAAVWKEERANELKDKINDLDVKVVSGMDGLLEVARQPESEILVTGNCRNDWNSSYN